MSGISSLLNIAKQALLAQQVAMEVAGNNVANVDTPGYTRQALNLTPALSYPSTAGAMGTGVQADYIQRFYDQFATQRIMQEASDKSNLDAQASTIQLVQAAFNDIPGLGLNDLMSQFWDAWQNLADNPEQLSTRQGVVQQATQLSEQFQSLTAEVNKTRNDIGVNLDSAVNTINSLTKEIAGLNTQITGTESNKSKANDLRDQRDNLLKQLSQMVDVNYFETSDGAYTVLLQDGHALVEKGESWQVDWSNHSLQWVTTRLDDMNQPVEVRTDLGSGAELGGKVGGLLEIYNTLDTQNPDSFAGKLNSLAYSFIREVNQQVSQGVGLQAFSGQLVGTEVDHETAILTGLVDSSTATQTIPAGTFIINDRQVGKIDGGIVENGLAMTKAANTVTAINNATTGVRARLTTLVAGDQLAGPPAGLYGIMINGTEVDFSVAAGDTAADIALSINTALGPDRAIDAVPGDDSNGGVANSIVLRNVHAGDDSSIVLEDVAAAGYLGLSDLGLSAGTFSADKSNTGEVTLFSVDPFTVKAGVDDKWLAQYNWDGGSLSSDDIANDGKFTFTAADTKVPVPNCLMGYAFADELQTNGGSFQMWIYNTDGTPALGKPVTVNLEGAFTLDDVAADINAATAFTDSSGATQYYVKASVSDGKLMLDPTTGPDNYTFAFANDTSNILQVAGLNTLFTGDNAGNIGINSLVENDNTLLTAGTVSDSGDIFKGDNSNALQVTNIQGDENVTFKGQPNNTLDGFYNALVGAIGQKGQTIQRDQQLHETLSNQLNELRDSVSGVSLDEEMANLIKFQQAYTAAAKLVTMSDEMLQTLLQTV